MYRSASGKSVKRSGGAREAAVCRNTFKYSRRIGKLESAVAPFRHSPIRRGLIRHAKIKSTGVQHGDCAPRRYRPRPCGWGRDWWRPPTPPASAHGWAPPGDHQARDAMGDCAELDALNS